MNVELLYFEGCPNWRETVAHLESLRQELGNFEVTLVEVTSPEMATNLRFHGSPSVIINGVDPFSDPTDPVGLTCRTYRSNDGFVGSPTREQLRSAIASAARSNEKD
jgi:hypothetical protein